MIEAQRDWFAWELEARGKERQIKNIFQNRDFLRLIFRGQDSSGRRCGIYLWPEKSRQWHKKFKFEVVGRLGEYEKNKGHNKSYMKRNSN